MKKIAFILLLFTGSLGWSQNFIVTEKATEKPKPFPEDEYNKLLNYTPKAFVPNVKTRPDNKVLFGDLNSISSLELRYAYQGQLKLNESELKWMEDEIGALATAFFKEGKPILLGRAGIYGDCKGKSMDTEMKNGHTVTNLKFCYTCVGAADAEDKFVQVFNNTTEKLIATPKKKPAAKGKKKYVKGKKKVQAKK